MCLTLAKSLRLKPHARPDRYQLWSLVKEMSQIHQNCHIIDQTLLLAHIVCGKLHLLRPNRPFGDLIAPQ